jgi:hypothetical protein
LTRLSVSEARPAAQVPTRVPSALTV